MTLGPAETATTELDEEAATWAELTEAYLKLRTIQSRRVVSEHGGDINAARQDLNQNFADTILNIIVTEVVNRNIHTPLPAETAADQVAQATWYINKAANTVQFRKHVENALPQFRPLSH